MPSHPRQHSPSGFSIVEVIVVFLVVVVLIAISIPVVRNMRELARRRNCQQNLTRLALAVQAYGMAQEHLPAGTWTFNAPLEEPKEESTRLPIRSLPEGYHHNWIVGILPELDQSALYASVDRQASIYADENRHIRQQVLPGMRCPAASDWMKNIGSSYAGVHASVETPIDTSNNGLLFANRWIYPDEIVDGTSYTAMIAEHVTPPPLELGWFSGTRSTLRNGGHRINETFLPDRSEWEPTTEAFPSVDPEFVGGIGSFHPDGVLMALADGSVRFYEEAMDPMLLRQLTARADQDDATDEPPTGTTP